jgi:HEAT repeat protein
MIAAQSLENIDSGNPKAIEALIKVLETTQYAHSLWQAAQTLGNIGTGKPKAIVAFIKVLETNQNDYTRSLAAQSLEKLAQATQRQLSHSSKYWRQIRMLASEC